VGKLNPDFYQTVTKAMASGYIGDRESGND
jgi:hypothetical protein